MLRWLERNLVLNEGEYLVPYVRGNAHAELNAIVWGLRNRFIGGSIATSTPGCPNCIMEIEHIYNNLGGGAFTHDNPLFPLEEILRDIGFFFP
jgi:hypothetical protein